MKNDDSDLDEEDYQINNDLYEKMQKNDFESRKFNK